MWRLPRPTLDRLSIIATIIMAGYSACYFLLPAPLMNGAVLLVLLLVSLPLLFHFQSVHRWDRKIGELSYPVYICHMAVIAPVQLVFKRLGLADLLLPRALVVVALTLVTAYLLNQFVGARIESIRNRIRKRTVASMAAESELSVGDRHHSPDNAVPPARTA